MQQGIVLLPRHAAAARGDYRAGELAELGKRRGLAFSKARLALAAKDLRDRKGGLPLDERVRFAEFTAEGPGEQFSHRALAAAGHADEDDVLHLTGELFFDARDLAVGDIRAEEELGAALGLRREHAQPVRAGDAETLGLHQQGRARGVVDQVRDGLAAGKGRKRGGRPAVVREHARGRGVDDEGRVGVTGEVSIVVLAAAGDRHDLPRALFREHGAHGGRRAAAAEDHALFARGIEAEALQQIRKTVSVRVLTADRPAGEAQQRVHAAAAPRGIGELRAVRHHGFFIGDRDVQAVPAPAQEEIRKLAGRFLVQTVVIVGEHRVDGGGIAVAQLFTQKAAVHAFSSPPRSFSCLRRESAISSRKSAAS